MRAHHKCFALWLAVFAAASFPGMCKLPKEKTQEVMTTRMILHENEKVCEPFSLRYDGKSFVVRPQVFSPKHFPETFWFADRIRIQQGDEFLEIGSGAGIVAVMAALNGAKTVTAVDINPEAVKNTTENAFNHGVAKQFHIYEGDLFDPIPDRQTFDVIFFFAPLMHVDKSFEELTLLEKSVFDPQYRTLRKMFSQGKKFLKPEGKLLLGYSTTHGDVEIVEKLAGEHGWAFEVIAHEEEQYPLYPDAESDDQADKMTVALIELTPLKQ